jgi:aryl-alcohol dehydrogenase-like predicted oxidoreductase
MDYVTLGKTGQRVSKIGLGCWQASADWSGSNDENVITAIKKSVELGVNLIDTAETYGNGHSETVMSRAIGEIDRKKIVIATKVAAPHLRGDDLMKALDASLNRLGVKQIDLYQIHWPDPWEQVPLKHTMRALEKSYLEGKIRAIGVSNFAVRDLDEARSYLSKTDIVSNQLRYNLLQREIEEEVLPYCRKEDITILAWSPLAQGALTGKYRYENRPKDAARVGNRLFSAHNMQQVEKLIALLSGIAERHRKSVAQVALNWLMKDPLVIPIPGAANMKQAEDNCGAADWRLNNDELSDIEHTSSRLSIEYYP